MGLGTELRLGIERVLLPYLAREAGRVAFGLLLVVLIPAVMILAIVVFALLGFLIFGAWALLGEPQLLAPVVGPGWFLGGLLIVALLLLRGHRWLSRLLGIADAPARIIDPSWGVGASAVPPNPEPTPIVRPSRTFKEKVAEADARHAPKQADRLPRDDTLA